jgi:hypothetical protein
MQTDTTSAHHLSPGISGTSTDSDGGARNEYVAFISGLDIGSSPASEAQTQVLVDYLTGACGDFDGQCFASQISRLVVLGNSLAPLGPTGDEEKEKEDRKPVRHATHQPLPFPDTCCPVAPAWERRLFLTTSRSEPLFPLTRLVPISGNSYSSWRI